MSWTGNFKVDIQNSCTNVELNNENFSVLFYMWANIISNTLESSKFGLRWKLKDYSFMI